MNDDSLTQRTTVMYQEKTESRGSCLHCHEACAEDADFCCRGCQWVYHTLQQAGLGEYYSIRNTLGSVREPRPFKQQQLDFAHLDDPENRALQYDAEGRKSLILYLEGVHCAACVWLVEKLPHYVQGVLRAELNLANQSVQLLLSAEASVAEAAQVLYRWGYPPHLVTSDQDLLERQRKSELALLMRMGVAAFSAGNLMILAVAMYAGLEGVLARYFEGLSLLLALPVLSYSAWPFYRQAWAQLFYRRQISIDVPIALSLIFGGLGGVFELLWGSHQLYFDSLATLVFLLLISRYTLMRTQQSILRHDWAIDAFTPRRVRRLEDAQVNVIALSDLRVGDVIRLEAQERIPIDGVIWKGQSMVDSAVLTGEPFPEAVQPGDRVYAGTHNQQAPLEIQVTAWGENSRLGKILRKAQENVQTKTPWVRTADRLARYFVSAVLMLAAGLCVLYGSQPTEALSRVLALVIVACPCALALASPLMVQISLKQALRKGFFVRNAAALEQLPQLTEWVFDKTGTLTEGRFEILEEVDFSPEIQAVVLSLESHAQHPIARALVQSLRERGVQALNVQELTLIPTGGVQGHVAQRRWCIQPDPDFKPDAYADSARVRLVISCDGQPCASLVLGDRLRPEAPAVMADLQRKGYALYLLSGDQRSACEHTAQQLGIPPERVLSTQTAADKERFFREHPQALMIGDGLNDMMALSKAAVGISVQGSAEENLQQADIYLAEQGLHRLPQLLQHATDTRFFMRLALGFSLIYNLFGISAALLGWVSPLVAAVLMPLSALSVFSIAIWGGQRLCKS